MAYVDTIGDIFRLTYAFTYSDGQVEEVDIHYRIANAGVSDSRAALLAYANTGVTSILLPRIPDSAFFYGTKLSTIKSAAPWAPVVDYSNTAGGDTNFTAPTQVRGLASWKTALSGRAYRGRSYIPTPSIDSITTDGKVTTACATVWLNWAVYAGQPQTLSGTTWVPGIYHRKPTAVISSTFDATTGVTVSNQFATQRRSGAYGRPNNAPF